MAILGWACECTIFNTIHLHWCKTCNWSEMASQNRWFLPVSLMKIFWSAHLLCFYFPRIDSKNIWSNFTGMLINQMRIGLATLQVGQHLKAMSESWVLTIWYILRCLFLFKVILWYLVGFHYISFLNLLVFVILFRRPGSWNFLKAGMHLGQTLMHLPML